MGSPFSPLEYVSNLISYYTHFHLPKWILLAAIFEVILDNRRELKIRSKTNNPISLSNFGIDLEWLLSCVIYVKVRIINTQKLVIVMEAETLIKDKWESGKGISAYYP